MSLSSNQTPPLPKFKFKNIGPVKNAELELGDLTVIAGRNNTGKSYLTYTLCGFLRLWRSWPGAPSFLFKRNRGTRAKRSPDQFDFLLLVHQAIEKGSSKCRLSKRSFAQHRRSVIKAMVKDFSRDGLSTVFSSAPKEFEQSSISIELGTTPSKLEKSDDMYSIQYKDEELTVSVNSRKNKGEELDVLYLYLQFLFPELSLSPFVLSAERFGISLFYRELDFTKNQLVDLLQKIGDKGKEQISPFVVIDKTTSRYALPIKDNIDYTRSIPDLRKNKSEVYDGKLSNDIKNMIRGYYKASGNDIEFRSTARRPDLRFSIPLHMASSSVRGLSDFYFFLRHVARKDHLLIIDEPESHLDTSNQIKLARLLAKIVQSRLKVLIMTHSDYLIKEINNLIMLDSLHDPQVAKDLRYEDGHRLNQDSVRAYVAEKSGLTKCKVDRFGVDMPVFDETIDEINDVSNELSLRIRGLGGEQS